MAIFLNDICSEAEGKKYSGIENKVCLDASFKNNRSAYFRKIEEEFESFAANPMNNILNILSAVLSLSWIDNCFEEILINSTEAAGKRDILDFIGEKQESLQRIRNFIQRKRKEHASQFFVFGVQPEYANKYSFGSTIFKNELNHITGIFCLGYRNLEPDGNNTEYTVCSCTELTEIFDCYVQAVIKMGHYVSRAGEQLANKEA